MAGFSRFNPDVIDLGTQILSGATCRLFASIREPYDGLSTTSSWSNGSSYLTGNAVVYMGKLYNAMQNHTASLGVNDPDSDTYIDGVGTFWKMVDGKDGDVWFKVSGATSGIYQKSGNTWKAATSSFSGSSVALLNSQTGTLAFSYLATNRTAKIDYYITSPGNNFERGELSVVNDGSDANIVHSGINSIGVNLGIDFDAQINGLDVEILYDSTVAPNDRQLFYILRN